MFNNDNVDNTLLAVKAEAAERFLKELEDYFFSCLEDPHAMASIGKLLDTLKEEHTHDVDEDNEYEAVKRRLEITLAEIGRAYIGVRMFDRYHADEQEDHENEK